MAALSCFISCSSEKYHLFFSTLRKSKDFEWTPACEQALQDLKRYLTSPPLLSKPKDGEQLYINLAISEGAVSAVLVREEVSKQFPICYCLGQISYFLFYPFSGTAGSMPRPSPVRVRRHGPPRGFNVTTRSKGLPRFYFEQPTRLKFYVCCGPSHGRPNR